MISLPRSCAHPFRFRSQFSVVSLSLRQLGPRVRLNHDNPARLLAHNAIAVAIAHVLVCGMRFANGRDTVSARFLASDPAVIVVIVSFESVRAAFGTAAGSRAPVVAGFGVVFLRLHRRFLAHNAIAVAVVHVLVCGMRFGNGSDTVPARFLARDPTVAVIVVSFESVRAAFGTAAGTRAQDAAGLEMAFQRLHRRALAFGREPVATRPPLSGRW